MLRTCEGRLGLAELRASRREVGACCGLDRAQDGWLRAEPVAGWGVTGRHWMRGTLAVGERWQRIQARPLRGATNRRGRCLPALTGPTRDQSPRGQCPPATIATSMQGTHFCLDTTADPARQAPAAGGDPLPPSDNLGRLRPTVDQIGRGRGRLTRTCCQVGL